VNRRDLLLGLPALAVAAHAPAAAALPPAPDLPLVTDLRADARHVEARRIPLVVLFSLPNCPYCHEVRRSHLLPLGREAGRADGFLLRQVNIGGAEKATEFDGVSTTHAGIAKVRGIRGAPEVVFWDARGRPVAEPLRGMLLPDFYSAYLEEALETASRRMRGLA
jgi:thioredoxin-related protein